MIAQPANTVLASWNSLDWVLAGIIILSALRGLVRGLLQALFGLAGVICGFLFAGWEYQAAAAWVLTQRWTRSPAIAGAGCYLAILVSVMVVFGIAGAIARRTAHAAGLGLPDRLLGALLGVVRGVLAGAALVLSIRALAPGTMLLLHSRLSSYFLAAGDAVSFVVPHTLH